MDLPRIVESLLFAADRPLTPKAIAHALKEGARFSPSPETSVHEKITPGEVEAAVAALGAQLDADGSSLMVQGIAGGFQLKTRPEFSVWTNRLFDQPRAPKLSQPALETLAVIAYRQPIGRAEIESVRGVAVDGVVATLLERKVIRVAGRSEQPGRPLLYETTTLFLELFGLKNLEELPNADELRRLQPPPIPHAPQQQQLDVDLVPADAAPADAGGPDRSRVAELLQQRIKLSQRIGETKRRHHAVIYVPERERELLRRVDQLSRDKFPSRSVTAIYREILSSSRAAQGQGAIGLLKASAAGVHLPARWCFGACGEFAEYNSWEKMAAALRAKSLALALMTGADLVALLKTRRWRVAFPDQFLVVNDFSRNVDQACSLAERIFIVTNRGGVPDSESNRILILIECKFKEDAVKSWLKSMAAHSIQADKFMLSPSRSGTGLLIRLSSTPPIRPAAVMDSLSGAGLSFSILGIYGGAEDYAG